MDSWSGQFPKAASTRVMRVVVGQCPAVLVSIQSQSQLQLRSLPYLTHWQRWHDRRCDRPLIRNLYFRAMQSINVMFGC